MIAPRPSSGSRPRTSATAVPPPGVRTDMAEIEAPADAGNGSGRKAKDTVKTVVTFPLGHQPFQEEYESTAAVGTVRTDAMTHFGVSEDPALRFYLVHDGAEVPNTTTLGEVAGHAKAVKFTLVKEIVNG
jgi:hypothetical protein